MAGGPILLADDNATNLKLLRVLLGKESYTIRTADSAEDALAVLQTFRPRLILMDIQLPGMDGLELTRRLKADPETRDIIILAVTSYAMKTDQEKAPEASSEGYETKQIETRAPPPIVKRSMAS